MTDAVKGSIIVDEIILPIIDMYLCDGKLWLVARVTGPVPDVCSADYVVCGRDGKVFVKARGVDGVSWSRIRDGVTLVVVVPLELAGGVAYGKSPN